MFTSNCILKPKEPPYRCELITSPDSFYTKIKFIITNIDKYGVFAELARKSINKTDLKLLIRCSFLEETFNIHTSEIDGNLIVKFSIHNLFPNYVEICDLFKHKELHLDYYATDFSDASKNYLSILIIKDTNVQTYYR